MRTCQPSAMGGRFRCALFSMAVALALALPWALVPTYSRTAEHSLAKALEKVSTGNLLGVVEEQKTVNDLQQTALSTNDDTTPKPVKNESSPGTTSYYTTSSLVKAASSLFYHAPRILVFTGDDTDGASFRAYTLAQDAMAPDTISGKRSELFIPLLADALRSHFPDRFSPGNLPFQLLYTTADVSYSHCTFGNCTHANEMAPWINAGSVFRNECVVPTVPGLEQFPNDARMQCLWDWRRTGSISSCESSLYASNLTWSDLYPTVIWRGSAFPFLQFWDWKQQGNTSEWSITKATGITLPPTPRQQCVDLSRQAERMKLTGTDPSRLWIDCRYAIRLARMSSQEMSRYRYQVDLGGAGGTTWAGTLDKLSFPGLLLHHETPSQDWFYPRMKPWVHFVPVRTDLSDLKAKYMWAEAHPEEAETIAKAGTAFVKQLMSREVVRDEYESYFVQSLGRFVRAYVPAEHENLDAILESYEKEGFAVEQFSECNQTHCATTMGHKQSLHVEPLR